MLGGRKAIPVPVFALLLLRSVPEKRSPVTAKRIDVPRCPYCVSQNQFRTMRVLDNGRQICENCGHIVFPEDRAFWCPCQKCLDTRSLPRFQKRRRRSEPLL